MAFCDWYCITTLTTCIENVPFKDDLPDMVMFNSYVFFQVRSSDGSWSIKVNKLNKLEKHNVWWLSSPACLMLFQGCDNQQITFWFLIRSVVAGVESAFELLIWWIIPKPGYTKQLAPTWGWFTSRFTTSYMSGNTYCTCSVVIIIAVIISDLNVNLFL